MAMVNMNNLLNGKDSRWLQLEVCREFQRNKCSRPDTECKFAHPPANVEVQNGRVTACYDSIKVSHLEILLLQTPCFYSSLFALLLRKRCSSKTGCLPPPQNWFAPFVFLFASLARIRTDRGRYGVHCNFA